MSAPVNSLKTCDHLTIDDLDSLAKGRAGWLKDLTSWAEDAISGDTTPVDARQLVDTLGAAAEALEGVSFVWNGRPQDATDR